MNTIEFNRKLKSLDQTGMVCSGMINEIRQLRLSVVDLFSTLADNGPDPQRNQQFDQENFFANGNKLHQHQTLSKLATSHSLCTSSIPAPRVQKQQEQQQQVQLLQYVNQKISTITASIRTLDQSIMLLMQNQSQMNTGESIHLAMECSVDKHNLYVDLCKSYECFTKLHEYSNLCSNLLGQQSLKRVHKRNTQVLPNNNGAHPALNYQHPAVATFNPYTYRLAPQFSSVQMFCESMLRGNEFMDGVYSEPFGTSTGVFQISINRVLKAILIMRGAIIDAVIVKAYHESFASKATVKGSSASLLAGELSGGGPFVSPGEDIDLWTESKYAVFRKLTHQAKAAILHFQYPSKPELALKTFLSWFSSHKDLFAASCSRCNSRLRKFMPPICRDFTTGFYAHHDSCR